MLALKFVLAAMLAVLALIYGLGFLCFFWWDGGLWRRILMGLCAMAVLYALLVFLHRHSVDF